MLPLSGENASEVLITKLVLCTEADLEALGFSFLEDVRCPQTVARHARLPFGWSKARRDRYGVRLLDAQGRHRGSIVEALDDPGYEGNGQMYLAPRFYVWSSIGLPEFHKLGAVYRVVSNTGYGETVLHETDHVDFQPLTTEQRIEVIQRLSSECEAWLDAHFPNWRNPVAYWDEPVEDMLH